MPQITIKDPELMLAFAFRYALGRRTYAPSAVVDELIENWDFFPAYVRERFQKEIKDHKEMFGHLGDKCDEEQWNRILNLKV